MVFLVIDGWFYANITERFTSLAGDLNLQPHSLRVASVEVWVNSCTSIFFNDMFVCSFGVGGAC